MKRQLGFAVNGQWSIIMVIGSQFTIHNSSIPDNIIKKAPGKKSRAPVLKFIYKFPPYNQFNIFVQVGCSVPAAAISLSIERVFSASAISRTSSANPV